MNVTNPKIERKKADIARTEVKFAEIKARLRQQKEELIELEDDEIVAMFRDEYRNEDFLALLRSRRESISGDEDDESEQTQQELIKEDKPNAFSKN